MILAIVWVKPHEFDLLLRLQVSDNRNLKRLFFFLSFLHGRKKDFPLLHDLIQFKYTTMGATITKKDLQGHGSLYSFTGHSVNNVLSMAGHYIR